MLDVTVDTDRSCQLGQRLELQCASGRERRQRKMCTSACSTSIAFAASLTLGYFILWSPAASQANGGEAAAKTNIVFNVTNALQKDHGALALFNEALPPPNFHFRPHFFLEQLSSRSEKTTQFVRLDFKSISFTVGKRVILDSCFGTADAGRLLAIMGPSGSGKTTLLNALAGQLQGSKRASLTGWMWVNGETCGGAAQVPGLRMAYVRQEDNFYTQMTVRETLLFTARLRLPDSIPLADKKHRVDELIKTLHLGEVANTTVGDAKTRGISGGERKRLAIGCELLSDPQLLFLDEPTSGLDSHSALLVVKLLKSLADGGVTVIMSIHQPSGSIFNLFDDLLLLADGSVMYSGPAQSAADHFAGIGFKCPRNINVGEFVLDIVSRGYDPVQASERIDSFKAGAKKLQQAVANHAPRSVAKAARGTQHVAVSGFTQFGLLFKRSWQEVARSRATLAIKVVQQLMIAFIYGGIYNLGKGQSSIQDRFGLLSLVGIGAANMGTFSTIQTFPKEKIIVNAERAKGMYSVVPYFLSKVMAEAPITIAEAALGGTALYPLAGLNRAPGKVRNFLSTLVLQGFASGSLGLLIGAAAPTTDTALASFPPLLIFFTVFNGINVAEKGVPKVLRWIPKVSFIRWCSDGLAVNELSGLTFDCDRPGPCCRTGEQVLERFSIGTSTVREATLAQSKLIGTFYLSTLYMLLRNKPKFLSIQPPTEPRVATEQDRSNGAREKPRFLAADLEREEELEANIDLAFETIDTDKSGAIDLSELQTAMEAMEQNVSAAELKVVFKSVDVDASGNIDVGENAKMVRQIAKPEVAVVNVQ